jgi:hypothetical protein
VGPILGSAFIIGLYLASRLLQGDLTDRMKIMNVEEDKRKRQVRHRQHLVEALDLRHCQEA